MNLTSIRNVTSITNTADISCINSFRFVSERVATAVFPTTAFGSGQRIDRQVIRINPEQLARAEVIPHPETNPTARALGGGRPAPIPPGIATRATIPVTGQRLPPTLARVSLTSRQWPRAMRRPGPSGREARSARWSIPRRGWACTLATRRDSKVEIRAKTVQARKAFGKMRGGTVAQSRRPAPRCAVLG